MMLGQRGRKKTRETRENKEEGQAEGAPNLPDVLWLLKTNLAGQQVCIKERSERTAGLDEPSPGPPHHLCHTTTLIPSSLLLDYSIQGDFFGGRCSPHSQVLPTCSIHSKE